MTVLTLPIALVVPLAVAALFIPRAFRRVACALAPWTALPALVAVRLVPPGATVEMPWLLFESRLTLDHTARVFLLFSAAIWLLAGVYARTYLQRTSAGSATGDERVPAAASPAATRDETGHRSSPSRFWLFYLLTMCGSLGVVLAGDAVTFYTCFALLGFASYGLIVHEGDEAARRAGRVYIGFVVAGEVLVFVGIVGLAALTGSTAFPAAILDDPRATSLWWLLFAGFGIKVGLVPLHMWLPLAHPAAPVPASAVLSGVIIKAGLLGWMRFLPLGGAALPTMGATCVGLGLLAAFGGVLAGLTQREPKAALAYSSVSQMGIVTAGIGGALLVPAAWLLLAPAILLYALHHAFAKATLFLAVGVAASSTSAARLGIVLAAAVPALALAGLPLTSGAVAKAALKQAMYDVPVGMLPTLLSLAAVGTTVLLARVLLLLREMPPRHPDAKRVRGLALPWAVTLAAAAGVVWLLPWPGFRDVAVSSLHTARAWDAFWPVATGATLAWFVWRYPRPIPLLADLHVPPGDAVVLVDRVMPILTRAGRGLGYVHGLIRGALRGAALAMVPAGVSPMLIRVEQRLGAWPAAGILLLCVLLMLVSAGALP